MTKAREIAELGQKLTVDNNGDLEFTGDLTVAQNLDTFIKFGERAQDDTTTVQLGKGYNTTSAIIFKGSSDVWGGLYMDASERLIISLDQDNALTNPSAFIVKGAGQTKSHFHVSESGDIKFWNEAGTAAKLLWDASEERLGIGNTAPSTILDIGDATTGAAQDIRIRQRTANGETEYGGIQFYMDNTAGTEVVNAEITYATGSLRNYGELNFKTGNAGTTASALRLTYDQQVGVNTTDPQRRFHVNGGAANDVARFESEDGTAYVEIMDSSTTAGHLAIGAIGDDMLFKTGNNAGTRIKSTGALQLSGSNTNTSAYTASISGTTMTVTSAAADNIQVGHYLFGGSTGNFVAPDTKVVEFLTGTGGVGTYRVDKPQEVTSRTIYTTGLNKKDGNRISFVDSDGAVLGGQPIGVVEFKGSDNTNAGVMAYIMGMSRDTSPDGQLIFGTHNYSSTYPDSSAVERMRLDNVGNLLIGRDTTGVSTTDKGIELNNQGYMSISRELDAGSGSLIYTNRLTSDGTAIQIRKDGSSKGSIDTYYGNILIGKASGARIGFGTSSIYSSNDSGTTADAAYSLGTSSSRFTDLYLSGGAYIGGTAAANKLDDYEEGTWTAGLYGANSATISTQSYNKYVKIGNWVYVSGYIDFSAADSSANAIVVTGLPYASASLSNTTGSCFDRYGAGVVIVPYMPNGQDHFEFYEAGRSSSQTWNQIAYNEVGAFAAHFQIAYRTA